LRNYQRWKKEEGTRWLVLGCFANDEKSARRDFTRSNLFSFLNPSFLLPSAIVVPTISPPLLPSEKGRRLALPTWAKSSKSRSAISFGTTIDRTMRYKRALGVTCSFHRQYRSRETSTIFGVDDEPWSPGGKILAGISWNIHTHIAREAWNFLIAVGLVSVNVQSPTKITIRDIRKVRVTM